MTEPITTDTATAPEGAAAGTDGQQGGTYTPPATQAELDKIVSDRLNRQKSQYKDFDTYKAAAAELEQIKLANQTEAQKQAAELTRWQTEAETWRGQAQSSRIQAVASDMFADPSDAVEALASSNYLDAGGQIDEAAIKADLAALLERKPHWAKPDGAPPAPRTPAPNPAQGSGSGQSVANPAAEFASILQSQMNGSR